MLVWLIIGICVSLVVLMTAMWLAFNINDYGLNGWEEEEVEVAKKKERRKEDEVERINMGVEEKVYCISKSSGSADSAISLTSAIDSAAKMAARTKSRENSTLTSTFSSPSTLDRTLLMSQDSNRKVSTTYLTISVPLAADVRFISSPTEPLSTCQSIPDLDLARTNSEILLHSQRSDPLMSSQSTSSFSATTRPEHEPEFEPGPEFEPQPESYPQPEPDVKPQTKAEAEAQLDPGRSRPVSTRYNLRSLKLACSSRLPSGKVTSI